MTLEGSADEYDVSRLLTPGITCRIVKFLQPNDVPCTLRLVNKATAVHFSDDEHRTIRLSQPVPHHAFAQHWTRPASTRELSLGQRRKLLSLTAASGDLVNLRTALRCAGCLPTAEVVNAAAKAGQEDALKELATHQVPADGMLQAAAEGGQFNLTFRLLRKQGSEGWSTVQHATTRLAVAISAARCGHVRLVETALAGVMRPTVGRKKRWELLRAAAEGCDLEMLQRLVCRWQPSDPQQPMHVDARHADKETEEQRRKAYVLASAAGSRTPDWATKVEWLEAQRGFRRSTRAHRFAARAPDALERLAWLRQRGYPAPDMTAVEEAARAGNVDAVRMLLPEVLSRNNDVREAAQAAAERGHLDVLKVLHAAVTAADASWREMNIAHAAASHGHLPVLEWLAETYGKDVGLRCGMLFCAAAGSGSVELMAWLRKRGCTIIGLAWLGAVRSGCEAALLWLRRRVQKVDRDDPYVTAAEHGDLSTLRCLAQLRWHWDPSGGTFSRCVSKGCAPPVLACLLELGCPVDWDAAAEAARGRRDEVEDRATRTEQQVRRLTPEEALDWIAERRRQTEQAGLWAPS